MDRTEKLMADFSKKVTLTAICDLQDGRQREISLVMDKDAIKDFNLRGDLKCKLKEIIFTIFTDSLGAKAYFDDERNE